MNEAVLRIFPCSRKEFPTEDDLATWILTDLKSSGGKYKLYTYIGVGQRRTPPGSIVLFRHGNKILGEAVIEEDFVFESSKEGNFTYKGFVKFAPSSIRLYIGFLTIETLENLTGKYLKRADRYYRIDDWSLYPIILSEVIKKGFYY